MGWANPPVNPVMKIYFFNLTNQEAFLSGREKPRVEKIGPYVYTETIKKVDVSFDDDGDSVTFSDNKQYYFSQSLSNGRESDVIVMPNIPMFGAFRKMGGSRIATQIFNALLNSYNYGIDKSPFLKLSVKKFLWGYPSLLMSMNTLSTCDNNKVD